jgi:hypothetical protein
LALEQRERFPLEPVDGPPLPRHGRAPVLLGHCAEVAPHRLVGGIEADDE